MLARTDGKSDYYISTNKEIFFGALFMSFVCIVYDQLTRRYIGPSMLDIQTQQLVLSFETCEVHHLWQCVRSYSST